MGSCACPKRPSCERHDHAGPEGTCLMHGHVVLSIGGPNAMNPACIWCNAPTQRTGACFTCTACGATTSC